jgi:hypothetical protein
MTSNRQYSFAQFWVVCAVMGGPAGAFFFSSKNKPVLAGFVVGTVAFFLFTMDLFRSRLKPGLTPISRAQFLIFCAVVGGVLALYIGFNAEKQVVLQALAVFVVGTGALAVFLGDAFEESSLYRRPAQPE